MASPRKGGAGSGPGGSPSIEPNPSPIAPLPTPATPDELKADLEAFPEEPPSLLDDPEIPETCLADLDTVIQDGMANYPGAAGMAKAAPGNFKLLFHEYWKDAEGGDDRARTWGVVDRLEKEIQDRD